MSTTTLVADLRRRGLTARIAAGAQTDNDPVLQARADTLRELTTRWQVADDWAAVSGQAWSRPAGRWSVPGHRAQIADALPEIDQLIAALCSPEPVRARGVAMAMRLLIDGAGPLYTSRGGQSLRNAVQDCITAV